MLVSAYIVSRPGKWLIYVQVDLLYSTATLFTKPYLETFFQTRILGPQLMVPTNPEFNSGQVQ